MRGFGLDPDLIQQAAREPHDVIAYIELHIEQGPVLEDKVWLRVSSPLLPAQPALLFPKKASQDTPAL